MHCWRHGGDGSMLPCCLCQLFGRQAGEGTVYRLCDRPPSRCSHTARGHTQVHPPRELASRRGGPAAIRPGLNIPRCVGQVRDNVGPFPSRHRSITGPPQVTAQAGHRPVAGQSQAGRRPVAGRSQASHRPVTGPCSSPIADRLDYAQYRMTTTCNIQHETHRSTSTTAHPCSDR